MLKLKDGNCYEQAVFLYKWGAEAYFLFDAFLKLLNERFYDNKLKIKTGLKSNLLRIAQKIEEN